MYNIAIGSDHAGFEMKSKLIDILHDKGFILTDCGGDGSPCDYPEIASFVCKKILSGECDLGILICGTGIGMSIAANKFKGIRAALCSETYSAKFSRTHNNANILCLGARVIGSGLAAEIADAFLSADYEGGRHERRLDLIKDIEDNN